MSKKNRNSEELNMLLQDVSEAVEAYIFIEEMIHNPRMEREDIFFLKDTEALMKERENLKRLMTAIETRIRKFLPITNLNY